MWTRAELKEKAKASLRANYWKAVLVSALVAVLAGSAGGIASVGDTSTVAAMSDVAIGDDVCEYYYDDYDDYGDYYDYEDWDYPFDGDDYYDEDLPDGVTLEGIDPDYAHTPMTAAAYAAPAAESVMAGVGIFTVGMVVLAFALATVFLVSQPFLVGGQRFFLRNLNQKAEVKEVAYAFDGNYLEIAKTMFFRALFTFLWALLFIVPGIVKSYEYRMIPYLLADDPTMTRERAFAESKRMMDGQKWNAFVLDLSFLGWNILGVCTLGILTILYVAPYQQMTNAALYERLRYGAPAGPAAAVRAGAPVGQPPFAPAGVAPQATTVPGGMPQMPTMPVGGASPMPTATGSMPQWQAPMPQAPMANGAIPQGQAPVAQTQAPMTQAQVVMPQAQAPVPQWQAPMAAWPGETAQVAAFQPGVAAQWGGAAQPGASAQAGEAAQPFVAPVAGGPAFTAQGGIGSQPPTPPYAASASAPYPHETAGQAFAACPPAPAAFAAPAAPEAPFAPAASASPAAAIAPEAPIPPAASPEPVTVEVPAASHAAASRDASAMPPALMEPIAPLPSVEPMEPLAPEAPAAPEPPAAPTAAAAPVAPLAGPVLEPPEASVKADEPMKRAGTGRVPVPPYAQVQPADDPSGASDEDGEGGSGDADGEGPVASAIPQA